MRFTGAASQPWPFSTQNWKNTTAEKLSNGKSWWSAFGLNNLQVVVKVSEVFLKLEGTQGRNSLNGKCRIALCVIYTWEKVHFGSRQLPKGLSTLSVCPVFRTSKVAISGEHKWTMFFSDYLPPWQSNHRMQFLTNVHIYDQMSCACQQKPSMWNW